MNDIVLVSCADDKFSMPLAISLYSALVNINKASAVNLFIIDGGISEGNKARINKTLKASCSNLTINWVVYNTSNITDVTVTKHISKATYLRILIPDLLPPDIDKAIYLDCDVIVDADLSVIWKLQFDDTLAMGVQDYCFPYLSSDPMIARETGLSDAIYCNAGVLVLNISAWRQQYISSKVISSATNKSYNDQQGINLVINGKWKLLDPRWNVTLSSVSMLSEQDLNKVMSKPFIIHYTSRFKPWHVTFNKLALLSFYHHQKELNLFFYYLKKSGWFNKIHASIWVARRQLVLLGFKVLRKTGYRINYK